MNNGESYLPAFAAGLARQVKGLVEARVSELKDVLGARLTALEAAISKHNDERVKAAEALGGLDERIALAVRNAVDAIRPEIREDQSHAVEKAIALLPAPKDGRDADMAAIDGLIADRVKAAVEALPAPKDGQDADMVAIDGLIADRVKAAVEALPTPKDGRDADMAAIDGLIADRVKAAVEALPAPKDGSDAIGFKSAFIDGEGCLTLTKSDGELIRLGRVTGERGADGIGFDDLEIEKSGERELAFKMTRGDRMKQFSFSFPIPLYRGVWEHAKSYDVGDTVTHSGSMWILEAPSTECPGTPGAGWRLAVKQGRQGKAGVGIERISIDDQSGNLLLTLTDQKSIDAGRVRGRDGRDLTQMGSDGRKWS